MSVIEITFNPALWAAGSGSGFGANGKNAFGCFLDKDGSTAWAHEYFGAGFARFNLSDGSIVHQDALFGTPGFTFLATREDGTPVWTQTGTTYFTIQGHTLYKFHIGAGTPGTLLNGYEVIDGTLDLSTIVMTSHLSEYEDIIAFASGGVNYVVLMGYLALFPGPNVGVMYLIDADTMSLVGTWSPLPTGNNLHGWKVFADASSNLWGLFADVNLVETPPFGTHLIEWNTGMGVTTPGTLSLTQATTTVLGNGLHAVQYSGTITGGASNAFANAWFTVSGFTNSGNNGDFICYQSTATVLTLVNANGVNEVHAGTAVGTPSLNVTDNDITSALVGFASPANFASYVSTNNSALLGDFDANLINFSLTGLSVNASNLTSPMYTNTFDAPESAMDLGRQSDGSFVIPGYPVSGYDAILLVIDPVATTVTSTFDVTTLINTAAPADPVPIGSSVPGFANMQYSSGTSQAAVTYEYVGSPVYLVPIAAASVGTTTTVSATPSSISYGNPITITATVVQNSGPTTPTGTVQFKDGANNLGSPVALNLSGVATMPWTYDGTGGTFSSVGVHALTATYIPTGSFTSSPSNTFNETVNPYATNGLVTSSEAPSNFEDEVTFTVVVTNLAATSAIAPTGTVEFLADGSSTPFHMPSPIPFPGLIALSASITAVSATVTVATYTAANSFALGQTVQITGFSGLYTQFNQTGIISSATSSQFTINGTYTAQSQVTATGAAVSLSSSSAQASTTELLVGLHAIQAQYEGDSTHAASNSNTLVQQVVNVPATTIQTLPGFALIASYTVNGDNALPPQVQLYAVPTTASPTQSIDLLWNTLNVAYVRITGDNHTDYQPGGFTTPLISTSGSGIYVVGNGFTADIQLTLQGYDVSQNPIPGLISQVQIVIT